MKPFWETKHNWWVSDFKYRLWELEQFKLMLRKHPDDVVGKTFRLLMKIAEDDLRHLQRAYIKIYGNRMSIRRLKQEMGI